jgi:hypothetical protein
MINFVQNSSTLASALKEISEIIPPDIFLPVLPIHGILLPRLHFKSLMGFYISLYPG